jgi:hypothetical protein
VNRRQAILSGLGITLVAPRSLHAQLSTQLSRQTDLAFDEYAKQTEAKLEWQPLLGPAPGGEIAFAIGGGKSPVEVKGGLIHDWVAAAVAPGASMLSVLELLQDYPSYRVNYAPSVIDSRLLSMEGDTWRVYLKLFKKQVLTAILNTEYDVKYRRLSTNRWSMISRSTKIAEVDNGRELPVGTGHGFLWRLNAYWLLEQRGEGVYMECRAISLSRDVPTGLGWIIKPMVTTVPRESLRDTMQATIKALEHA